MTTSLLNKTNHTKPKPSIPSNPLKHNNFLTQQNSLEKSKPSLSHEHTNSNNNPLPLSSPINALLPPVIQTKENTTCEILIADFEFRPKQARVKINSKVQWTIGENKTSHQSGIYSTENRNFVIGIPDFDEESDLLSRGQTFEFYFNKTGNFDVICSNYPRMQGKVEVYGDEEEIMFKKVQHEMKARGLLLTGKQFAEKFFGHNNNHKPILTSPPPKKIQEKCPSPYKNLEEAHSEEDSNVQELLQELNAKGPSIKSNKSKGKGGKKKEFEFDDERNTEELFKQLRSRSEASDEDDDIRNFSLDTSDAYRMSDNEEEEDKDEELETKYNQILMSPSRFTIHEIMKMGAKLENSMIKKEKLEEEKKRSAQEKEIIIEPEAPVNQGDILIEIRQELENNDHEEEKLKDMVAPSSEKEVVVNLDGEQEKENLNEKPKKKNKNKKKKKKKAAGVKNADPSVENTPPSTQDTVNKEAVAINPTVENEDKKEVNKNEGKSSESNKKVEPKIENNKQQEKPKDLTIMKETQNKAENKNNIEKENKNVVVTKTTEPISKPLIEEQKFQMVIPSSTVKQSTKEIDTDKKKTDNNKKGSTGNDRTSKVNESAKASAPVQQQISSSSKVNEQKASEEAKSQQTTPTINEKPKEAEDAKNVANNNKETNNKKKKKKNNKKRKELNRQNSALSEPKTEVESIEKLEPFEAAETPSGLTTTSPILVLKEAIPLTAETSEANSSEEKEPALLGNEAFLAFLKDAVKPEASKYQKSFRSNKNKNKKSQKEIDYSEEDDRIAALSAFLSNRYDYAEAFN